MDLVREMTGSDIQKVWLQFPADKHTPMFGQSSSLLELVQRKGTEYDNNYHDTVKGGSFHHLCFSVPDIHKARQRLSSLGVETMDINPPRTDILILYDPDRHPIQLLSQDLDKHEELAKVCREVVLYGAERAMQDIRQSDNPVTLEEAGALANGF
ncbi:hypothetical protein MPSI1_001218 [Malassezia psittaci]|uniref:VOC domain-containing protein n=1 Tax=Malassezia psittaci TaxID=1821823 RepID=A0AAF0F8G8_9BASI|nr:hypothetical protein MPSI1_001218 [Malassezia psittaci]